jgi:hypothetical protein
MIAFVPRDEVFDEPDGWIVIPSDPPFRLRHKLKGRLMYCETLMTGVRGRRDVAARLLLGRWGWWKKGRAKRFRQNADGTSDQILTPVWWYTTRIGLHNGPATPIPSGTRVPIVLYRMFQGSASIDVVDAADGTLTLRGRFHGVENHVPLIPLWMVVGVHLRAEAGILLFPFPRGTGWPGLARAIAAES